MCSMRRLGSFRPAPGASDSRSQHLDSGAKDALEKAMDALMKALDETHSASSGPPLNEVRELVIETKAEVAKPKPNMTKVKSLVTGIGGAISFTPKLKDAYDTVKWAGAMIGIPLP